MPQHDTKTPWMEENIVCAEKLWEAKRRRTESGVPLAHPKPAWEDLTVRHRKELTEQVGDIRTWFESQDSRDAESWRRSQVPQSAWNGEGVSEQASWDPRGEVDCVDWPEQERLRKIALNDEELRMLFEFDRGYRIGEHFVASIDRIEGCDA